MQVQLLGMYFVGAHGSIPTKFRTKVVFITMKQLYNTRRTLHVRTKADHTIIIRYGAGVHSNGDTQLYSTVVSSSSASSRDQQT